MNDTQRERIDRTVDKLAKPIYVLRMQRAKHGSKSKATDRARLDIQEILQDYYYEVT